MISTSRLAVINHNVPPSPCVRSTVDGSLLCTVCRITRALFFFFLMIRRPRSSPLFPHTALFRSRPPQRDRPVGAPGSGLAQRLGDGGVGKDVPQQAFGRCHPPPAAGGGPGGGLPAAIHPEQ